MKRKKDDAWEEVTQVNANDMGMHPESEEDEVPTLTKVV